MGFFGQRRTALALVEEKSQQQNGKNRSVRASIERHATDQALLEGLLVGWLF
jgi:hypothetical protein